MPNPAGLTRRDLLKSAAVATAAALGCPPAGLGAVQTAPAGVTAIDLAGGRILAGWEHYRGTLGGSWEIWRGDKASDNVPWRTVDLPHCFNARDAVDPDTIYYQGPGWYRTTIPLDTAAAPGGRTLLVFEGAGQTTTVWVHTQKVGSHVGGYDEWRVDLTDWLARIPADYKGAVPVAVCCDNSRDLERIPSALSDFNLYGGLYRHVRLVQVPAISIERIHVATEVTPGQPARVEVRARLYNPTATQSDLRVTVRLTDPGGRPVSTTTRAMTAWSGEQTVVKATLASPALWSPERPALYRCDVTIESEHGTTTAQEAFGLRFADWVERGPFRLNGERLLLRGTQRHEDHAGLGAALTDDLVRRELRMIKHMGANFIRLGHYQQSRLALQLCDELGLLVWEEVPWCRGGVGGERYRTQARDMLRAMIDLHFNHPSVILWGLGNENDWPGDFETFDQAAIQSFMRELNDLAHQLDPSRKTAIRRCDFCKDIPDVYSPSIWAGWYRGRYTEYKPSSEEEMKRVRHFFHAEWGGDSHAGRHSEDPDRVLARIGTGLGTDERGLDYLLTGGQTRASRDGDWSETYICNLFDWHLKEQETMPWLTGAAQWIFKDFSTPLRGENPVPRMNQKGLVERDLTPKEGYYVFQSYWAAAPMVHIYGHSWPVRWGEPDEQKFVKVYSNCEQVELFVNGVSAGIRTRNSQDFPAAGLRWLVRLREGDNVLRAVAAGRGAPPVSDEIRTTYQTARWGAPARLTLAEGARDGETVRVETSLQDAHGVVCLDSRAVVRFGLAGSGRLLDNLGTVGGSRVVELTNGRGRISLVRAGGPSTISVSAKGVPTTFLLVP
ncbi:MAG TPA: glycoside hydrolase family 2 TIM barrel-domain containing protein [Vicinamibacterales bacterium]|jgi:beta-galactosidase